MTIRLADFIRAEIEPILRAWEEFAETILPAMYLGKTELRDHAQGMLMVIADDLDTYQSKSEQAAKSKGLGSKGGGLESWAEEHGGERQISGFSIQDTVSEFRALRASVVSLWTKTNQTVSVQQLEDLTRFHEAIDQAVTKSLNQYATVKEMDTRLFSAILLTAPDPIYVLDLKGRFVYANKATADLFGLDIKAIIGKSTIELGFPFASDFQRNMKKVIAKQSTFRGKFAHRFTTGQGEKFEYLLAPVLDEHQKTETILCISRDITEQALAEEKTWHSAHHDLLTGLPNRRLFLDRLDQETKHAKRSANLLAVLFMDLDDFKEVNDSLGHEVGDLLLSAVAKRLTDCVREDDTVARLGGDEFTVILTGTRHRKEVELVAKNIIDALKMPFIIRKQPVQISVSIGITFYPRDASSPATLLEAADQAMYKAKKMGSSRMCFSDISDKV